MSTGDAIGVLVALAVWGTLILFVGIGVGHLISRRNRRR
jgi:uncharacterized protein YneF (UPF0154 family)